MNFLRFSSLFGTSQQLSANFRQFLAIFINFGKFRAIFNNFSQFLPISGNFGQSQPISANFGQFVKGDGQFVKRDKQLVKTGRQSEATVKIGCFSLTTFNTISHIFSLKLCSRYDQNHQIGIKKQIKTLFSDTFGRLIFLKSYRSIPPKVLQTQKKSFFQKLQ